MCREVPLVVNYEGITKLCSDFKALLGSSLFSDVEIVTKGGSVISSHAVILAARSPPLKEVSLTRICSLIEVFSWVFAQTVAGWGHFTSNQIGFC